MKILSDRKFCTQAPLLTCSPAFHMSVHQLVCHTGDKESTERVSLKGLWGAWASRWKGLFFQMVPSCTLCGAGSNKRPCNGCTQLSQHMKCVKSVLSSVALPAGYGVNLLSRLLKPTEFAGEYKILESWLEWCGISGQDNEIQMLHSKQLLFCIWFYDRLAEEHWQWVFLVLLAQFCTVQHSFSTLSYSGLKQSAGSINSW